VSCGIPKMATGGTPALLFPHPALVVVLGCAPGKLSLSALPVLVMVIGAMTVEHLYVHVPFCAAKCNYCAFYSEAGSAAKMAGYVDAVLTELRHLEGHAPSWPPPPNGRDPAAAGRPSSTIVLQPTTIFFGGGTPSILPVPLMRRLLEPVSQLTRSSTHQLINSRALPEWTIECNPSTVSTEKAKLFRDFGVNRISMGVQSFDDDLLKRIGRIHTVKAAIESCEKLRRAGFDNVNLDLMFGLPGQTMKHWRNTLCRAIELQPEHISTYCLILEEDTEFWSLYRGTGVLPVQSGNSETGILPVHPDDRASINGQAGRLSYFSVPTDDEQLAMYKLAIEVLEAAGYRQYEVSNFAKPGRECAHNIAYWKVEDYIGLGPSACSTVGPRRWQNVSDIDRYIAGCKSSAGVSPVVFVEHLTPELRAAERAAFGMRMTDGVPADLVRGRWDKQIAELLSAELVQWRGNRLPPTKRGILFADEVAAEFVGLE
jgi:oxygen-independent coproporphyrinogen III oxidase